MCEHFNKSDKTLHEYFDNEITSEQFDNGEISENFDNGEISEQFDSDISLSEHFDNEIIREDIDKKDIIKDEDYVIICKDNNMWLHKVNAFDRTPVRLKKDHVSVFDIIGRPYFTRFRLVPFGPKRQRFYILEEACRAVDVSKEFIKAGKSGQDNRHLIDDGMSQQLSGDAITELHKQGLSGVDIVGQLVENSRTFTAKTEFSQQKYLKRKQRKYLEYVTIQKPTLRLIAQILFFKSPGKLMQIRIDTVSQILSLCNIRAGGRYIVYETGCQGLMMAAVLDRVRGTGDIVHVHPGNIPQRQAVIAMNFSIQELRTLHALNVSYLCNVRKHKKTALGDDEAEEVISYTNGIHIDLKSGPNIMEQTSDNMKSSGYNSPSSSNSDPILSEALNTTNSPEVGTKRKSFARKNEENPSKKQKTVYHTTCLESQESVEILYAAPMDALIIVGREDPLDILLILIPFLGVSRNFVVFCTFMEPLMRCYWTLKERSGITNLRVTETLLRNYQVLPGRTHPNNIMSGAGGYLLSGTVVGTLIQDDSSTSKDITEEITFIK